MKNIFIIASLFLSTIPATSFAATSCGDVKIMEFISGPRHGSMMRVEPMCPGQTTPWVCLDVEGEKAMTKSESTRLYAMLLMQKALGKQIALSIDSGVYATSCNVGYPVVEDVRTR